LIRPQIIFFDVGLVLLNPDGRRLHALVLQLTGQSISSDILVNAYRRTIYARDEGAQDPNDFPFWSVWLTNIGADQARAAEFADQVAKLECDREKLWTVLDRDAVTTLTGLISRGVQAGAISNADGELVQDLERANIGKYLQPCIDSVIIGAMKPSEIPFRVAADQARAALDRCWMVGDDYLNDIEPSIRLGFGASILFDPLRLHRTRPNVAAINRLSDILHLVDTSMTG
jgi:FMN phosphatase YigB (HAD superfamily)